ncbi:sigma-70 family RNA polymerase sigma factor [Aeoliella sp. SH292]|uniref:sigma-70 family RNA polymerase sigma factor n=1 Tax=Aeoliella sp. SH292 TaxID=3454464 RepID=UPI003F95AB8C
MSQPSSTTADSSQPPPSDEGLMAAIQQGDTRAFEELYDRYSPLLYPVCLSILHNACDAQGVLLDLFWELWRSRERFNPERGSVRSYLMTLARSRAIDHLRAGKRYAEHQQELYEARQNYFHQPYPDGQPAAEAMAAEEGELVREALETLTHAQRESLQLAYFDGLTHQQIAERTGTPLGSVKSHIRQGLIKLRAILRRHRPGGTE